MEGSRPRRKETPRRGLTRRLRRGLGLVVQWGAHTFLSMAKEKCAKESQRHGTPGKSPLLPILTAGLAMSRAMELDSFHQLLERARARLFPPSKWAGLFPSAVYRRSSPPAGGAGQTQMAMFGTFLCSLDISTAQKTSVNIESRWPFLFNEHEVTPDRRAARPVAERR